MAQDLPPSGPEHFAGAGGRPPFGSDPRQPWEYGQEPAADVPFPPGQQWQESIPAPRVPEEYPGGYRPQAAAQDHGAYTPNGYAESPYGQSAYGQSPYGRTPGGQGAYGQEAYGQAPFGQDAYAPDGYPQDRHTAPGYAGTEYASGRYLGDVQGGQAPYDPTSYTPQGGYDQQSVYAPQSPYGEPEPYAQQDGPSQQLYAPAGTEQSQDGYVPYESLHYDPVEPDTAAGSAADAEEATAGPVRAATNGGAEGDGADGVRSSGPAGGTRTSLVDRARSAAGAVVSADHAPGRRALAIRSGAGVAALGVLLAAGLMVSGESGGDRTSAGSSAEKGFTVAHTKAWAAEPAAAAQPGADDTLLGSWLLGEAVVRAQSTGVQAYDLTSGKPTWSVEPPVAGAVPCGLSPSVNAAGLGAALFRPQADPNAPCTLVVAVDTKAGKAAWTKTLSDAKEKYGARIGVTEDKVIAIGDDKAVAWQSADGADVWQYTGQGKFCTLAGGVEGKTVVLHSSCADSTPVDQAVSLHTADGKVGWWRGLNNRPRTVTVLSAEPAVVATTGEKPADDRVFAWGAEGDPATEIPVVADDTRIDVVHGSFSATPGMYFQDHTMAVTLTPVAGGPVSVAAYDLTTGKQLWKAPTAEKGKVRAVGLDNGALLLAADERLGQPARLSRFALSGGDETVGGNFPQGTGSLLIAGRVLIGGGKVIAVPEHSSTFGVASAYQAKG
ncbi:PQQ-binding-like beta-propeller repeat protein [Kitasatospora sp. NPDC057015]|uniref:outer membrane protein assembly factor BamB family protein n=1 Tax=Kitasatospora sp. NPDC057015 TaxID=3346001 RepID=UPI003627F291